jgi:hypothetical protein
MLLSFKDIPESTSEKVSAVPLETLLGRDLSFVFNCFFAGKSDINSTGERESPRPVTSAREKNLSQRLGGSAHIARGE